MSLNETSCGKDSADEAESLEKTLEECVRERIERMRDEANQMEAGLARLPLQVRRMTRFQARAINLYF